MIQFKNITKTFGSIAVLHDVSFEVEKAEFAFITGPSGAGKTTILRLILREILPDRGQILVGDRNLTNLKNSEVYLYRRQIGMVFQDFKLLADRTIGENVALALAVANIPGERRLEKVREVLSQVGLKQRGNSFPSQLAGGELQRAVVARAIVNNPKILLADEPTGNLDPDTAWEIIKLLDKICESGTTVLMATHNREIVDRMARHVIELKDGKVVRDKEKGKYHE